MGFLEKVIVTPSHHRVHHAINPEYLDKNYSQIFIFWDKLFGTFQEELPDKPPVYGITRPVRTWNPIKINFQHLWLLIKDAWRTQNLKDKLRIWFMPTGWRPADVADKYPVYKISDVYDFEKYDTKASFAMHVWSWVQLLVALVFVIHLFGNIAVINALHKSYIFWYGGFVFFMIYALTDLMDRNRSAILFEAVKCLLGFYFLYSQKDWFGASAYIPFVQYILAAYLLFSVTITLWFVMKHAKEDMTAAAAQP